MALLSIFDIWAVCLQLCAVSVQFTGDGKIIESAKHQTQADDDNKDKEY